jgi:cellulose synthase operon protein C
LAEQWLKLHPRDIAARRAMADGHARAGNFAAARAAYEALVKVAPDDAEALNNLANVLLQSNDPGALAYANQALAKKPEAPYIIGTAGWAAFKAGQTDRALQLLRDARLRDPANPDTRYFLSAVLASLGRNGEAKEELKTALQAGQTFAYAKDAEKLLSTLK